MGGQRAVHTQRHSGTPGVETPRYTWYNPETGATNVASGTSDLEWCKRVMRGDYLRKAGWTAFADEHGDYPFLVDTDIFCGHINPDGTIYPDRKTREAFGG